MADTPLRGIKLRVSVSGWKKRAEILKSSAELGSFTLPINPRSPAGSVCIYQRARLAPGQHGDPPRGRHWSRPSGSIPLRYAFGPLAGRGDSGDGRRRRRETPRRNREKRSNAIEKPSKEIEGKKQARTCRRTQSERLRRRRRWRRDEQRMGRATQGYIPISASPRQGRCRRDPRLGAAGWAAGRSIWEPEGA